MVGAADDLSEKSELKRFNISPAALGDPSTKDVDQLEKEMRERLPGEIARTLIDALEEKAGARESKFLQVVARLGHVTWRLVAISAGVGAVVVAVSLAPFLARATTSPPPAPHILIIPRVEGGPSLWVEAESFFASNWGEKRPLDQQVPRQTLPGQRVAPCDEGVGEEAINGNCWAALAKVKPPCGRLFRHGDLCYRPIAVDPKRPVEPGPDR